MHTKTKYRNIINNIQIFKNKVNGESYRLLGQFKDFHGQGEVSAGHGDDVIPQ